ADCVLSCRIALCYTQAPLRLRTFVKSLGCRRNQSLRLETASTNDLRSTMVSMDLLSELKKIAAQTGALPECNSVRVLGPTSLWRKKHPIVRSDNSRIRRQSYLRPGNETAHGSLRRSTLSSMAVTHTSVDRKQ